MATSSTLICGVCEARHVTKCADHWCPECEEGLCSDCQEHHSLSKSSRKHVIISIENYKNLPVFVADISDNCTDHDMKFTNYCPKHDSICCPACITTDHENCTELRLLQDIISNSKSSALISLVEDRIQKLLAFVSKAITDRTENLETVKQNKADIAEEIRQFRIKINTYLDQLEGTLMESASDTVETTKSIIEKTSTELSASLKRIEELDKSLHALKGYGSDLQTFFGTKKVVKEIDKEDTKLGKMYDEGQLHFVNLKVSLDSKVADAIAKVTTFGSVSTEIKPGQLQYPTREDKEAQILSTKQVVNPMSIENIQITLLRTIEKPKGKYRMFAPDCVVTTDGHMMFSDYSNHRLIILDSVDSLQSEISVPGLPTNVTIIDDKTAAVSTSTGIQIIDIVSKQIKQTITTKNNCSGITYHKGLLLWCWNSVGIQSKQLPNGDVCTIIPQGSFSGWSYLAAFDDKIFQTLHDAVTCFTMKGDTIWKFEDKSILNGPRGITIDNNCNIYIAAFGSNKVVVLSPDGQNARTLFETNKQQIKPYGVYFDRERSNILISNIDGSSVLYHVSLNS